MIIFRYISQELYAGLLGILMVLLIIFMSNQFIHYLHFAASGHITMGAVMKLMSLQIPFLLGYLIPLSLYLAILLVFGRLYLDHEMTVMSACGVSPTNILTIILSITVVMVAVVGALMLWLEPIMDNFRVRTYYESAALATVEKVIPKRFQSLGPTAVFYADEVDRSAHKMTNIFFAQRGKKSEAGQGWDITVAASAQEQNRDEGGRFMLFKDGYRYLGTPGLANYQVIQYGEYGIRISKELKTRTGWPSNASTMELWPKRHDPRVAAELQWRIAMPVSTLILALLAFPLSRVNPRRGKFTQLLPAILLYIVYGNLLFLGRAWVRKGLLSFGVGLWWVHGFMLLVALGLIFYRWRKNAYS